MRIKYNIEMRQKKLTQIYETNKLRINKKWILYGTETKLLMNVCDWDHKRNDHEHYTVYVA